MKYYLISSEYEKLKGPFECTIIENKILNGKQVVLVAIEPWLSGVDYGLGLKAIKKLFLISKYKDSDIKRLDKFPIDVHVIIPDNPDDPLSTKAIWSQMLNIGWAELIDYNPTN